jgi:phosphoribosylformylglycinamidine (FGAM) synthase-like amidotransferase family enzyme
MAPATVGNLVSSKKKSSIYELLIFCGGFGFFDSTEATALASCGL